MSNGMSLELLAYRALVKLGRGGGYMSSFEAFKAALDKVSLCDGRTMRDGPIACAALAINSFPNVGRGDYGDTYKSAATVIEMDAMGEPWEERSSPSADEAAEVLELMLFDAALSEGEDWQKEDQVERVVAVQEAARRARNARRRERRRELKLLALATASTAPTIQDGPG